ncbi:MAG: class I SAM-dependent methyltransferase [Phycisphaerales bacterium]|nr:class I SAM-dependent methyltransferase [Phycisphaerales bacterium]
MSLLSAPARAGGKTAANELVSSAAAVGAPRRAACSQPATGWLDRLARRAICAALARLEHGTVVLEEKGGVERFGRAAGTGAQIATLRVHAPAFYRKVALGGALGAGEAYIEGLWSADDLTTLIRILAANETAFAGLSGPMTWLAAAAARFAHALRRNSRTGSRANIAAHYDLSNAFYALWLDETMTYSSAVFESPAMSLADAQRAKLERVCRKLGLRAGQRVVEIGSGWGSFALHAAGLYGCHVTTTTISRQQYVLARERIATAGLGDRIDLLELDYRDLRGQFDRLASIEMIEAVGWQYYDAYFARIAGLLRPDGAACIQAITMPDRYYERAKREVDFIKRFVFPGSCIPSLGAIAASVARATDLTIHGVEDLTPHYALTLRRWRENFMAALPQVRRLGFDDAFVRRWEYYLSYCEAGFAERTIGLHQIVLVKPAWRSGVPAEANAAGGPACLSC